METNVQYPSHIVTPRDSASESGRAERTLPTIEAMGGSEPDIAGGQRTEDYVWQMRGGAERTLRPAEAYHPGEYLLEEFGERGWEAGYVAEQLGVTVADVWGLMAGERDITPELALALGRLLGTSAVYWGNLQDQWLRWRRLYPGGLSDE